METARALKDLAVSAFSQKKYQDALELYSQALQQVTQQKQQQQLSAADSSEAAVLSSNIAAVFIKLDRPEDSLQFATAATQLNPSWAKGYYRQAIALHGLQQHTAAATALQKALDLTPPGTAEAQELSTKLSAALSVAGKQQQHESTQRGLMATHAAWANNRAREAHTAFELKQQLQQGMAGYAWEPEDWQWRPTWTPSMRAAAAADATTSDMGAITTTSSSSSNGSINANSSNIKDDVAAVTCTETLGSGSAAHMTAAAAAGARLLSSLEVPPGSTQQQQEQYRQLLAQLTLTLAELEAPQRGLRLLQDQPLLSWYQHSIKWAVAAAAANTAAAAAAGKDCGAGAKHQGRTVLVLANGGGGLLGLFAAAAGAGKVVVVEKWRWGHRASKQLLEANRKVHGDLVDRIELVPGPLSSCYCESADSSPAATASAVTGSAATAGSVCAPSGPQVESTGSGGSSTGQNGSTEASEADMVVHIVGQQPKQQPEGQQHQGTAALAAAAHHKAAAEGGAHASDAGRGFRFRLLQQADVLVTDMFDSSVLGQGVLHAAQSAAAAGLLSPNVLLVPEHVTIRGQLVNSRLSQRVSGFDLSPVNKYKWHPTIEHIDHARYQQLQCVSPQLTLQELGLTAIAKSSMPKAMHSTSAAQPGPATHSESAVPSAVQPVTASASEAAAVAAPDNQHTASAVSTTLHPGCSADALAVWFELKAGSAVISTGPQPASTVAGSSKQASAAATMADEICHTVWNIAGPQQSPCGLKTHSTGMGLGLYYLDSPTAGQAGHKAATAKVLLTTRHSPAAVRLLFEVGVLQEDAPGTTVTTTAAATGSSQHQHTSTNGSSGYIASTSNKRQQLRNECAQLATSQQLSWHPHGFPRHAWLPRWHFDMLADTARNNAYDAALRRAITSIRSQRPRIPSSTGRPGSSSGDTKVHVLDLGAGTGLLSMLAMRCGADKATAVESVRHMADIANQVKALNHMPNITVVHKDARYLSRDDMKQQADLLVFEVFDCGCIGEGALHIVAAAKQHLKPGARILPATAQVYCQPIQYGTHIDQRTHLPYDTTALAPYAWQPDYCEADLQVPADPADAASASSTGTTQDSDGHNAGSRSSALGPATALASATAQAVSAPVEAQTASAAPAAAAATASQSPTWKALADPQPVFHFDFNTPDPHTAFQPAEQQLQFEINTPGVMNAVAFWFELRLDQHTTLGSSPYVRQTGQSTTWKQAVQLLPEHPVQPGQVATLTAKHDTYAISFQVAHSAAQTTFAGAGLTELATSAATGQQGGTAPIPTGVPLFDPVWRAAYDQLSAVQSQLAKSISQDPLEHRRVTAAALQLAMQPWKGAAPAGGQSGGQQGRQQQQQQQQQQECDELFADPHHAAALLTRLMG